MEIVKAEKTPNQLGLLSARLGKLMRERFRLERDDRSDPSVQEKILNIRKEEVAIERAAGKRKSRLWRMAWDQSIRDHGREQRAEGAINWRLAARKRDRDRAHRGQTVDSNAQAL